MSDKDDRSPSSKALKGTADTIQRAGIASAVAGLTGTDPRDAAVKALVAGSFAMVVPVLDAWWRQWTDSRREQWWQHVVSQLSPEEIHELLKERLEKDAAVKAAVLESLRALSQALDDAVIPVLGALASDYIRHKRPADGFLRGFSRAVSDMSAEELQWFREIVVGLVKIRGWGLISLHCVHIADAPQGTGVGAVRMIASDVPTASWYHPYPNAVVSLFRTLRVNGIAHDSPNGALWMLLDATTVLHAHPLLGGDEADFLDHIGAGKSSE